MSSDVEEIKNRISIVDLVGEYVRLQKAGSNHKALCPFHNEKTPSFMVSEERRSFHCFGCGKGGDIFTFVMEMEGLGFREALERLAEKAGVELKRGNRVDKGDREDKGRLFQILELATKWYEKNLWEGKGKEKILGYLRERGLTDESIKKFRLGYAPDGWRNILDFLIKKGHKIEDIAKTGLLVEKESEKGYYDRFRDRIMFPIQDVMGRVVGFSARVAPGGDEKTAKYVNTPQTGLYDKSKTLYGLHLAKTEIKKRDSAVLVEGNMDVIASHQAGFPNTIAVSGTALTPEQVKIIKRYAENLEMGFDMDSAGQAAAKRSIRICLEHELNVKVILLSGGKDAADVIRGNPGLWKEAVERAKDIMNYYFGEVFARFDPRDPAGKKRIARELLNVIRDIANPVERSHWLKILAEKLETDERVLVEVIKKAKSKEERDISASKEQTAGPASRRIVLAKRIIGILAAYPAECRRELAKISPDDFREERDKRIIAAISENPENANIETLKAILPDYETGKFLDGAVFEAEVELNHSTRPDPAEELRKNLGRLKSENAKERIVRIARDIKTAEKDGDKKKVKILMNEFQKLTSALNQIN